MNFYLAPFSNQPAMQFRRTRKATSTLLFILMMSIVTAWSQSKVTGFVVDDDFGTPIEKAVVRIPGTLISVLTDQQGKFSLKLRGGDYYLEIDYPGYATKKYNMSTSDHISTPMYIVKLKANAIGRELQRNVSSWENKSQLPQSAEDFNVWQTDGQKGLQEFNELFRMIPSANLWYNGSGMNDSRIGFRGHPAEHTGYTLNGISLSNPETGRINSGILSGLSDQTGQVQVITGLTPNMHLQTKTGGTVNVLSPMPGAKSGVEVSGIFGNDGLLKTTGTVHSGLSKKGLASTFQLSRTSGKGQVQNTAYERYGFTANILKEFNHRHSLWAYVTMNIQQHDMNSPDSIGVYNLYTTSYNPNWGKIADKPYSWSTNYGRNQLISLTHFWQWRIKTSIATMAYVQMNRSAQLIPSGMFNGQSPELLPRDTIGLLQFDKITDWNKGLDVPEMGAVRPPDESGKFVNTEINGITTLAKTDNENRFGLRTTITHKFNKKVNVCGSLELENYYARHFGAVNDLLQADSYTGLSDLNRPTGFPADKLFRSGFYPNFNSANKTGNFYESGIQTGGLSFRINYESSPVNWFLGASATLQRNSRTDHYHYLETDPLMQTNTEFMPGVQAQTGMRFSFWKYHSIHLRATYASIQPLFTTLFPFGTNNRNTFAENEQIVDTELGYTIFSRKLKIEASAYYTIINNRSMISTDYLNQGDAFGLTNGLEEVHKGLELKSSYKIFRNMQIYLNGSLGNWSYANDGLAYLYNTDGQLNTQEDLLLKDVRIANAPQLSLNSEVEVRMAHHLYLRLNFSHAEKIFAPFSLYDFRNLATRDDFEQWNLPSVNLLGFSGNYLFKIGKSRSGGLIFGANNLLDTEYIEQAFTNIPEGNPAYTSNRVFYGTGRTWYAGITVRF